MSVGESSERVEGDRYRASSSVWVRKRDTKTGLFWNNIEDT